MKIGIDVLGGDFAPEANLEGAILARRELPEDIRIVLIGDQDTILDGLSSFNEESSNFDIVHAPDVITMHDHPTRAIPQKPNSSIAFGFELLSKGEINAFASTGNTGAMLVGSIYRVNTIPGVIRPCITSTLPCQDGSNSIILDVGSNADCKPDVLYQFAILGSLYAEHVLGKKNPKVALLSIGEEESKGNLLTQSTHKLLQDSSDNINFIGNVEGRDLFTGRADVIVCDGFTGNIVLKEAEGIYSLIKERGIQDDYFDRFNYENYGGTPILGIKGNVTIGHGISNGNAVKNMLIHTFEVANSSLISNINQAFN